MSRGCLYRPKKSRFWWMKYYVAGRARYESTETENKRAAQTKLNERLGRVATGQPVLPRADRVKYQEVAEDLKKHYETTGRRDVDEVEWRLGHLDKFFDGYRVAAIGPAEITRYISTRQEEGASNGTVNRELAVLGRMLRLAYENGKLLRVPVIHKLKEAAPRRGFFEREQYEKVRRHLSPDLQCAVAIEYELGWRCQSEVLPLERRQIDLAAGTIRLDPGTTKNDEGRVVYLSDGLKVEITAQLERVRALERKLGRVIPYLFPHVKNGRRYKKGDRVRDFRKAWAAACVQAGFYRLVPTEDPDKPRKVPTMLRHDFRRTAVRDLVNLGTPERLAMKITGHKTRAVFDRYHIVSPADLQEAARRRDAVGGRVPGGAGDTYGDTGEGLGKLRPVTT